MFIEIHFGEVIGCNVFNCREMVEECLDEEDLVKTTVGQALLFEAILTLAHLSSLHSLLPAALQHIRQLLN